MVNYPIILLTLIFLKYVENLNRMFLTNVKKLRKTVFKKSNKHIGRLVNANKSRNIDFGNYMFKTGCQSLNTR